MRIAEFWKSVPPARDARGEKCAGAKTGAEEIFPKRAARTLRDVPDLRKPPRGIRAVFPRGAFFP